MKDAGFAVPEIQNLSGAIALFMKYPHGIRFEITHYAPGTPEVDWVTCSESSFTLDTAIMNA